MTLIASFLVGSLLSLLLPTLMLVALVVWYLRFVSRVPDTELDRSGSSAATATADEGPELSHTSDRLN